MSKIVVDPVTRIEGHLRVDVQEQDGVITEARCSGTMARGLELIFRGRDPRDIPILAQRICGVCPQVHATAASMALDEAIGLTDQIPANGLLLRDIMLASNYFQSHILHFYQLAALDYVDVTAAAGYDGDDPDLKAVGDFIGRGALDPFVPRYEGDYRLSREQNLAGVKHYVTALQVRRNCHEMLSIFGGKMPHQCAVAAGGVTTQVTLDKMTSALTYAREVAEFIERCYLPDVLMLARAYPDYLESGKGCSRFLSYGVFAAAAGKPLFAPGLVDEAGRWQALSADRITEDVKNSYYADESDGLHPAAGQTVPAPAKVGAYSWLKAPRYDGKPCEVGPLARMMVTYAAGSPGVKEAVDAVCGKVGIQPAALNSTLGRHAARAVEASILAGKLQDWILRLQPGEPCVRKVEVPQQGKGAGLIDGPRGALGHWITIDGGKVANYQAVVPTTWNGSPRDSRGVPGPIEQALESQAIRDLDNPFEVVRTIRSFDPCLACSVHMARRKGSDDCVARV